MLYLGRDPNAPTLEALAREVAQAKAGMFEGVPHARWLAELSGNHVETPDGVRITYDPRLRDAVLASGAEGAPDMWPLFDAIAPLPAAVIRGANSNLAERRNRGRDETAQPGARHRRGAGPRACALSGRIRGAGRDPHRPGPGGMTDIAMIRAAATRLEGHARRTPLLSSPFLDEIAGRRIWLNPNACSIPAASSIAAGARRCRRSTPRSGRAVSSPIPRATTRRGWRGRRRSSAPRR